MRQFIGDISRTLTSGHLRARISKPSRITLPQEALRLGRNRQKEPRNGYISMYHSHKSEPGFYYMPRIIRTRWWSDIRAIRGKRRRNSNSLVSIQSPDRFVISDRTGGCWVGDSPHGEVFAVRDILSTPYRVLTRISRGNLWWSVESSWCVPEREWRQLFSTMCNMITLINWSTSIGGSIVTDEWLMQRPSEKKSTCMCSPEEAVTWGKRRWNSGGLLDRRPAGWMSRWNNGGRDTVLSFYYYHYSVGRIIRTLD